MANRDSFDRMASEISDNERQRILDQMHSTEVQSPASLQPATEILDDNDGPFEIVIKKESSLIRFWIWLKAIFTNTTQQIIYNEYKLSIISKNVHKSFPGLINTKQRLILSPFYDQISDLKACADFFRPYFVTLDDNDGPFYVFLSSFIMPQVTAEIKSDADPYKNPVVPEIKPDIRSSLVRRLEEIIDNIPAQDRASMYLAAKAYEWLRQFSRLPFSRLITKFSAVNEKNYCCDFDQLENEIDQFSSVLCNSLSIPDDFLEALYMFALRNSKRQSDEETGRDAGEFLSRAHSCIASLQLFMNGIPIRSLGCLIHNNWQWHPNLFSSGEDWFVKYKASSKKIFDQKWAEWESECKKMGLLTSLKANFGLAAFPKFPERPWEEVWNGLSFPYDTTLGFINWFMRENFSEYEIDLKTVLVQGSFTKTENHTMLSDAFNAMIQLSISLQEFERKLSVHGEVGGVFNKIREERSRTLHAQNRVDQLMREVESDYRNIEHRYGDTMRAMVQILGGILGISKDSRYDTVSNLNKLFDRKNEPIVKRIEGARDSAENALNFLMELEQIDRQKRN